jgi:hypothetical protein
MNTKKFVIAFIVIFVILEITNYIIYEGILKSAITNDMYKAIFRPEEDMNSKMWLMWVMDLVWSYFFAFFFVKGYENKGWMEGLRYGVYIGIFFSLVMSFTSYVVYPFDFGLTFQMFVYGFIQSIILGIAAALIYKPKAAVQATAG